MPRTRPLPRLLLIGLLLGVLPGAMASAREVRAEELETDFGGNLGDALAGDSGMTLTVEGQLLSGPNAFLVERGGRLLLPLGPIARALGDSVAIDAAARRVSVQRATGGPAAFDGDTGQVEENGVPILVTSATADLVFTPDADDLLLPVELLAALLDLSVVVDPGARTVRISRDQAQVVVREGARKSFLTFYDSRYAFQADLTPRSFGHNLQAQASGRMGDGRFRMSTNLTGNDREGLLELRHALLTYERPSGERLVLGDAAVGQELRFLTAPIRGGSYRQPVQGFDVSAFAGAVRSGEPSLDPFDPTPVNLRYDTTVVGSYVTLGRRKSVAPVNGAVSGALGGMWFTGPSRSAGIATAGLRFLATGHRFQTDVGFGTFQSIDEEGRLEERTALMLDATESLTPTKRLTLTAGFTYIGEGYLSPQSGGALRPMRLLTGGMSWQPTDWLGSSVGLRHQTRLELPGAPVDQDATMSLSLRPGGLWPSVVVTHTRGIQSERGGRNFTLVNVNETYGAYRLFGNWALSRLGPSPATGVLTVGGSGPITKDTLGRVFQTYTSAGTLGGGFDVTAARFFSDRVSVTAGVGYAYDTQGLRPTARLGLTARLPGEQTLQLNVVQSDVGAQGFLMLQGPIFTRPEARLASRISLEQARRLGTFSGRIYQDVNLDGAYDPEVDRPLPGVRVLIDGSNAVVTDATGYWRIDNVLAGRHTVRLDLLTVRADLTMLGGAEREVILMEDRDAIVDFRLVRTGRLRGRVFLDADGDGSPDEDEEGVANVRVLAGRRDTLTAGDGELILGDLPEGSHPVSIDEKTLPHGLEPATPPVWVTIEPARETSGVLLPVREKEVGVEIKEF